MNKKNIALIVSGGEGKRLDKKKPKQFFKINEKTILEITVKKFIDSKLLDEIVVICSKDYLNDTKKALRNQNVLITLGGKTRQDSVYNGLKFCKKFKLDFGELDILRDRDTKKICEGSYGLTTSIHKRCWNK